jgi:phenylalanyl-tRNA synthetase beta chain
MKIPFSIIKSWTKFKGTPDELKSLIDLHITEVEEVIESGKFSHMVVGEIIEILPHPNADKLQITKTKVGDQTLQIVCGGKNIAVGQKVPVALPGSMIASGIEIKEANIRGEDSFGMLCSGTELGMDDGVDGVMILDKDLEVGTPLAQIFDEAGDVAFDLKVLANRPDYMSWLTIAREVSASLGTDFTYQLPIEFSETRKFTTADSLSIKNSVPKLCSRYMGRVVKNIQVEPSPTWLQAILLSIGLRPINNIVDAANLVMLETGQPIHVFDLAKIHRGALTVRTAKAGETIACLDDQTRKLTAEDIVIADGKGALAIAGIIGGTHSAVALTTTDIAIEVANFDSKTIRLSSRRLGVRTDASSRFERGVDIHLAPVALGRLLNLIHELSPTSQIAKGAIDIHAELAPIKREISFNLDKIKQMIDLPLTNAQITKILISLGIPSSVDGKSLKTSIPSYRSDISLEADIAEEIIRIHGLDKIQSRMPQVYLSPVSMPNMMKLVERVSGLITRLGFVEVKTHPFTTPSAVIARSKAEATKQSSLDLIAIENPLTENWTHLKTNLLSGLMSLEYQSNQLMLFEINKTFIKSKQAQPIEITQLAVRIDGSGAYSHARSVLSAICASLGVSDDYRELSSGLGLEIVVNQEKVGEIIYHTDTSAGFVIDLDKIIDLVIWTKSMVDIPKYPEIKIDLAFEVNDGIRIGAMQDAILASHELVVESELFDVFSLSDAKRSAAFHLVLRSPERTLTKEDREAVQSAVIEKLGKLFQATLRG